MLERRLAEEKTEGSEGFGDAPRAARNSGVAKIGSKSLRGRERLPSRRKSSGKSEWQKSGRFYIGEELPGFVGEFDGLVSLEQNRGDFELEVEIHGVAHRFEQVPQHVVSSLLHAQHKALDETLFGETVLDGVALRLEAFQNGVEVEGMGQSLGTHFLRGIVEFQEYLQKRKLRERHRSRFVLRKNSENTAKTSNHNVIQGLRRRRERDCTLADRL